jgi:hypothetical protein
MKTLVLGLVAALLFGGMIAIAIGSLPSRHESIYNQVQWQQRH